MISRPGSTAERAKASERKARYRARLRDGGAVLTVPTRDLCALIEAVMVLGWLRECEAEDRAQVGAAIGALLEEPTFEELFAEPIVRLFTARDGVLEACFS